MTAPPHTCDEFFVVSLYKLLTKQSSCNDLRCHNLYVTFFWWHFVPNSTSYSECKAECKAEFFFLGQVSNFKVTWWRHQMETFSMLLAICPVNSSVTGEFHTQRPVTRSFDVFFDLHLNKRLSKQWWGWWFETKKNQIECFRTLTAVWIHRGLQNDAENLKGHRRGALSIFEIIFMATFKIAQTEKWLIWLIWVFLYNNSNFNSRMAIKWHT